MRAAAVKWPHRFFHRLNDAASVFIAWVSSVRLVNENMQLAWPGEASLQGRRLSIGISTWELWLKTCIQSQSVVQSTVAHFSSGKHLGDAVSPCHKGITVRAHQTAPIRHRAYDWKFFSLMRSSMLDRLWKARLLFVYLSSIIECIQKIDVWL